MRFLHASDLHIGQTFVNGKSRQHEFQAYCRWLRQFIVDNYVDVLLLAGDIFDTIVPPIWAQELYAGFLSSLMGTCCRHIVIIGGNHDSARLLEVTAPILKFIHVDVVGGAGYYAPESGREGIDYGREIVPLYDSRGHLEAVVCAVPFLREGQVCDLSGANREEKWSQFMDGMLRHYSEVARQAEELIKREQEAGKAERNVPLVGMGHLYAQGGLCGGGEHKLYYASNEVGGQSLVDCASFPRLFDYTALGHLHKAQKVGGFYNVRYSGSALISDFSELGQDKYVLLVDIVPSGGAETVQAEGGDDHAITARGFKVLVEECRTENERQPIFALKGTWPEVKEQLESLVQDYPDKERGAWVSVEVEADSVTGSLSELIAPVIARSGVECLKNCRYSLKKEKAASNFWGSVEAVEVKELTPMEVFAKLLEHRHKSAEESQALLNVFEGLLQGVLRDGAQAQSEDNLTARLGQAE